MIEAGYPNTKYFLDEKMKSWVHACSVLFPPALLPVSWDLSNTIAQEPCGSVCILYLFYNTPREWQSHAVWGHLGQLWTTLAIKVLENYFPTSDIVVAPLFMWAYAVMCTRQNQPTTFFRTSLSSSNAWLCHIGLSSSDLFTPLDSFC